VPSCESSRPSHRCLAASTPSPTSADLGDSARTTATVTPASNSTDSTHLDPLAPMFTPRFVSSPSTTYPSVSVLQPVDSTSTADPDPYAVDGDVPRCDEFSRGRPPEFELDGETQLKVPAPPPNLKELELPEHVNVLFLQTVEDIDLPEDTVQGLKSLYDRRDTFASSSSDLGYCRLVEHDIDTGDSRPIKQSPRRPPIAARAAEDEILDEMLETGVIEPSNSSWASPVCLVKKQDGTFRFCIDYRRVNAVSKKDAYPIPNIQDALDNLRGSRYFATIDLLSGYWQLGMTDRAKERSAFCTRRGLFQFRRMPFGLSGAPGSFCRLMPIVLRDLLWVVCLCYLNDIVVFARSPQELLERLRIVLDRLRDVGLKAKPSKCELFKTEIEFLSHMVSADGISPLPDKLEAIRDWPVPPLPSKC